MTRIGLPPDPWQERVLRSTAPQLTLNCSRQAGKSTVVAALTLHTALYTPRSLTLCLAPAERQSKELFRKVLDAYQLLGRPVSSATENTLELEMVNRSRIVALPGKEATIRSFSGVNLLIIDEAARVADNLYRTLRPMLAVSRGRLLVLSTPFGRRGFFYDLWDKDAATGEYKVPGWERISITAAECPRIDAEFLADERRSLGEHWWKQEYMCSFEDVVSSVFAAEDVRAALTNTVKPIPWE